MTEALAAFALISIAIAWFSIPFIPTVEELRRRTEARPLIVDRENDGEVRHFARRFKAYLQSNFRSPTIVDCIRKGVPVSGHFHDGTEYRVVARDVAVAALGGARRSMQGVVVFTGPVVLPERLTFSGGGGPTGR